MTHLQPYDPIEESPMADPDWSDLPADVLATVLGELEFPDLSRSAAACTTWRAAARSLLRLGIYNRPQTPCLLYTTGTRAAELFSLADRTTYKVEHLPDPPIRDRKIVGSSHGWLVTADARSELLLLNPATGEQHLSWHAAVCVKAQKIRLPAHARQHHLYFYDATLPRSWGTDEPQGYAMHELRDALYLKVVLSCDPSRGDCIAMMIHNPYRRQLSFARVGGEMWHWATTSFHDSQYSDCIFHEGAFYAMNSLGGIHRYTIEGSCATRDVILKDVSPSIAHSYISRISSGDVLQIRRMTNCYRETACIEIYKVDFDKQKIVDMHTLGHDALFLGHNYTCCISTKDCPMLLPNHVYFTDDDVYRLYDRKDNRRSVGTYSLEDKHASDVVSPQHWLNQPIPVWITPCFTKIHM